MGTMAICSSPEFRNFVCFVSVVDLVLRAGPVDSTQRRPVTRYNVLSMRGIP